MSLPVEFLRSSAVRVCEFTCLVDEFGCLPAGVVRSPEEFDSLPAKFLRSPGQFESLPINWY